jgi:menaquinone-9 beta-reductase
MELMEQGPLKTDVFIVGGGPAGLVAAISARQRGLSVVVGDSAQPPIDKTCGEGLMPNTLASLEALGISLPSHLAMPFRGIRFIEGEKSVEGKFPQGFGLGIRRTALHKFLVEKASEAGVKFMWGHCITGLAADGVELGGQRVQSRWIIGADGYKSQVRKWAGLDHGRPKEIRYGFRQHFRVAPWSDYVEVHWGGNCQIVVTLVSPTEVCLVVTSRSPKHRIDAALEQFPEISRRLEGKPAITRDLGSISAVRVVRNVCHGNVALVGDASGSVDSLTGEGLGLAFQQALALADALARRDLSAYQFAHPTIQRSPVLMSRLLLAMERFPWLRRRVFTALAKEPQLFGRLLDAHVQSFSPRDFGFANMLKLGRGLLAISG